MPQIILNKKKKKTVINKEYKAVEIMLQIGKEY